MVRDPLLLRDSSSSIAIRLASESGPVPKSRCESTGGVPPSLVIDVTTLSAEVRLSGVENGVTGPVSTALHLGIVPFDPIVE